MRRIYLPIMLWALLGSCGTGEANDGFQEDTPQRRIAAETSPLRSGSRLKVVERQGADGATLVEDTFFDNVTNQRCSLTLASDQKTRCLPQRVAWDRGAYGDPNCKTRLYAVSLAPKLPTYVRVLSWNANCGLSRYEVRELKALVPSKSVYQLYQNTCTALAMSTVESYAFYTASAPIAPAAFVSFP